MDLKTKLAIIIGMDTIVDVSVENDPEYEEYFGIDMEELSDDVLVNLKHNGFIPARIKSAVLPASKMIFYYDEDQDTDDVVSLIFNFLNDDFGIAVEEIDYIEEEAILGFAITNAFELPVAMVTALNILGFVFSNQENYPEEEAQMFYFKLYK